MTMPDSPPIRDLKSRFCERYDCWPLEYEERAFRMCLYGRARLLAPLIRKNWPGYFERDFMLIRYLGRAQGKRDAINELSAFMEDNNAKGGFARKMLRLRISAPKARHLVWQLFDRG